MVMVGVVTGDGGGGGTEVGGVIDSESSGKGSVDNVLTLSMLVVVAMMMTAAVDTEYGRYGSSGWWR